MSETWPWTFDRDDAELDADPGEFRFRLQEVLDKIGDKFPVGLGNVSRVPQARVFNSAALTIATGTATALTFNSERWDTDSIHDTGANTSRLTCVTPGLYAVSASVDWASNTTGYRSVGVRLNGATYIASVATTPGAAGVSQQTVATQYQLVAGDYVEAVVFQNSGGNLNVTASANYSPEFSMHWVSP